MTGEHDAGRSAPPAPPEAAGGASDGPRAGRTFPIVGVGASAGGLEAFSDLLRHLPLETGMGIVLVQHLDPDHDSALAQILGRVTPLPVREATHNLRVEPDHVYVIPPNTNLGIAAGVLTLIPRQQTRAPHRSIDFFFQSLAEDQHERAIGVILSGTATDGTLGLEAIKAEGGITFAQDGSARYDSMPRSAVAAGCVDFVLSPEQIARELARIAAHPAVAGTPGVSAPGEGDERASTPAQDGEDASPAANRPQGTDTGGEADDDAVGTILRLLRNRTGVDFSLYKPSTIQRRITRRMVLDQHITLAQYARFLRAHPKALDALYLDALIGVTSFFRNPDAFDALKAQVWPVLLRQSGDAALRAWVLGCSTGQEAYSLAMTFVEAAEQAPRMRLLQVFATDLNEAALDKARYGLYAKSLVDDVSPERLRRFFVEEEGGYRIGKALREMVVFARQNVISDPPFSRLDLISCRNLLIYLKTGLQRKVFPVFHYALKPGGFLFLGASESVGGATDLFEATDKKYRIYVRKTAPSPSFQLPARKGRGEWPTSDAGGAQASPRTAPDPEGAADGARLDASVQREADRIVLSRFAPPSVLINADLQVLQFRGAAGAYLEPAQGRATLDVLKMARPGLMLPLRAAVHKAITDNVAVRTEQVRVERDEGIRTVHVEVLPLKHLQERCFLIVFEDAERPSARGSSVRTRAPRARRGEASRRIAELEAELAETRDYLQSVQEQHDAAHEVIQASNEEVQSANEELQSINEELETSKEELESANEELTTVNEEMASRNAELNRLNSDLVNVQTSIQQAMVLVGRDLTVRRFSAQAEKQFNLLAADVGRPIGSVRHTLDLADLEALLSDVIDSVHAHEREVRDLHGRWFSLRVRPYLTLDNKVDGAVLVLVDIDDLKRSEQAVRDSEARYHAMFEATSVGMSEADADTGRMLRVNEPFARMLGYATADLVGRTMAELTHADDRPGDRDAYARVVRGDSPSYERETRLVRRDGAPVWTHMTVNLVRVAPGRAFHTVAVTLDISARKRAEEAMRESEERYRTLFNSMDEGYCVIDVLFDSGGRPVDFRFLEVNAAFEKQTGLHDVTGRRMRDLAPDHETEWFELYGTVARTGEPVRIVRVARALGGRWFDVYAFRLGGPDSRRVAVLFTDVTDRRRTEEALRESDRHKSEFLAVLAHELRNPLAPIRSSIEIIRLVTAGGVSAAAPGAREAASVPPIGSVVEVLERQVGQMVRLVDDLLDIGRISHGKIDLRMERVDVSSVVQHAVDAARPLCEHLHHALTVTLPQRPAFVHADPVRLTQIVGNLVNNSCKFTGPGGRIWITVERGDEPDAEAAAGTTPPDVAIRVRDTGIGIAADQLPHVFDMFTQAETTPEPSRSGLGIGLALVKTLVQMHGGTVTATSAGTGRGSEFVVRLPAAPEPADAATPPPASGAPAGHALRILVVDDNRDAAEALALLLQFRGHEAHKAYSGPEAVDAALRLQPDAILLDIGLPGLDGYEAARRIRAQQGDTRPILVAVTGWGQDEDRRRSENAGFDAHVVKPVDDEALVDILVGLGAGAPRPPEP